MNHLREVRGLADAEQDERGSSDTDVNEFAVIARMEPSTSAAITVTPVTNCPTV